MFDTVIDTFTREKKNKNKKGLGCLVQKKKIGKCTEKYKSIRISIFNSRCTST